MNDQRKRSGRYVHTNHQITQDVEEILTEAHSAVSTKQRLLMLSRIERVLTTTKAATTTTAMENLPASNLEAAVSRGESSEAHPLIEPDLACQYLVEGGILSALLMQLNFILQRHGTTNKEVDQLFLTMHLLTRNCQGEVRQQVTAQLESPGFLELIYRSVKSLPVTLNVARLLHTISGSEAGSLVLVKCQALILSLVDALSMIDDDVPRDEILLETLGCLKNITCYAEEQRPTITCLPGLIPALASICLKGRLPAKVAERMSAIFRNLLLSHECRRTVGRDPIFMNALFELVTDQSNRRVLRNVLNILHSLSLESDVSLLFVMFGDGVFLNVLMHLLEDDDSVIRRRSVRTFRLWTNESSAPLLVHRQDVMAMLSDRAIYDENQFVRSEAAEAFSKCAGLVSADEPHHRTVLQALVKLSKSPGVSTEVLGRAFKEQASHPDNRVALAGDLELLKFIARIAMSPEASVHAREDACCALHDLSMEECNRKILGNHLCVLDALVDNAETPGYERSQRRRYAVQALVHLSNETTVRTMMVKHDRLLKSLIRFASTADAQACQNLKSQVKQTILALVKVL
jgi:HEAT repeat protein